MKIIVIIILIAIGLFLLTRCGSKEKYSRSPSDICLTGCFSIYSDKINEASDKCGKEFPYPDDQQKCLENTQIYKDSRMCMNSCHDGCVIDMCLNGCHYLYDQNMYSVSARCDAEYPTVVERQKCFEGDVVYQDNQSCLKSCESCQ